MSIKKRLIIGGVVVVCIPFIVASIIIYRQLSNHLIAITQEQSLHIANDIAADIETVLNQEFRFIASIAVDPITVDAVKTGDYREVQKKLEAVHERVGSKLFTVFIADKEGISRADAHFKRAIGLDVSDRDYFLMAKEGKPNAMGLLHSKGPDSPDLPLLIIATPIQIQDDFYGIVAMPMRVDFLMDVFFRKAIDQSGHAFLIDAQGLVLVHPRKEYNLNFRFLDQPGTEAMAALIAREEEGTVFYTLEGSEEIAGLTHVDLTDWIVVFSKSKESIMAPMNDLLFKVAFSGIIFLFLTIVIIIIFSGRISMPIQQTLELIQQVTKYSSEIIVQIGLDRKITYVNPAFENITGLESKGVIGTEPDFSKAHETTADAIWNMLEAGRPWSGRVTIRDSSKDACILEVMILPLRDASGHIHGYVEIGRDVSGELLFEKRLQQAQKLEAIGNLAGGIAHDFNNILSGIVGYAELSLMNKAVVPETQGFMREIIKASERARALISQILTFSRQTGIELRPLFPKAILREALKLLRASIPATIDIESKIECDSAIMADPTGIHQVVMNLFTNSVHAIGENTGTITIELEDFFVGEEFLKAHPGIKLGKHIILRISDTGRGIKPEAMDHIFEPFFTTKSQGEGTGLGLSVVHGIVKKLEGIITVYSELGKGTRFNIIIPITETDESELPDTEPYIRRGTERIAIIDDEPAIITTMQSILTNLGYKVSAYTDSTEALAAIKSNPDSLDMVVTDYAMPKLTGLEIALELKAAGIHIPVVLVSGYFSTKVEESARNSGITELVSKPISTHQLVDAIQKALRTKDA